MSQSRFVLVLLFALLWALSSFLLAEDRYMLDKSLISPPPPPTSPSKWGREEESTRGGARGGMSCLRCHKKIREMTATDVHSQHGVLCTSCHKGDPSDYSIVAMSGKKSHFKGKPSRREIPSLCGSCHSRPDIMAAYGLPSSQEGEYLKSRHGRLWAKGDSRVPVCTTCHGAHGILPKDDPAAPTSRANVNGLCDSCHGDPRKIRNPKTPTDQYAKYKKSVHGKAFDGNNKRAPTCALCHGHHTTQASLVEKSFSVCDRCHGGTAYQVSQSPHQKPIEERKIKQCVACHGYHDVQRPEAGKMEGICAGCHRPDLRKKSGSLRSRGVPGGAASEQDCIHCSFMALLGSVEAARSVFAQARKELGEVKHDPKIVGLRMADLERKLEKAETSLLIMRNVLHTLSAPKAQKYVAIADTLAREVLASIKERKESLRLRRLALIPIWAFVLGMVSIIALKRRALKMKRVESDDSP